MRSLPPFQQRWLAWASVAVVAVFAAGPGVAALASLAAGVGDAQAHIWSTVGPRYLAGTLGLCAVVGLGAVVVGAGLAALVTFAGFPGRRIADFMLAAPLAAPAYVVAYAYGDMLSPFGSLATFLDSAGLPAPDLRSFGGAAFVLTLTNYPYVYLATRAALSARSARMIDAARALGASPVSAILRVMLPASRAAIAGGAALAMMETAGDFGVADYFGVPTLSTGVFRTWNGMGDLVAASQLAAGLFLLAVLLTSLEAATRRGRRDDGARSSGRMRRWALPPVAGACALVVSLITPTLGLVLPAFHLLAISPAGDPAAALSAGANSAIAGICGAGLAMTAAVILAYGARSRLPQVMKLTLRAATLGYAMPGALVGVGVLAAVGALPGGGAIIATSGLAVLVYAYAVRFLTAGFNYVSGGLEQIGRGMDEAARSLGAGAIDILAKVHAPLIRPALLAGAVVVFIDIVKELPATLILRPFDFETLATRTYRLASDERLAEAAPDALALIALGLAPTLILSIFARRAEGQPIIADSTTSQINSA